MKSDKTRNKKSFEKKGGFVETHPQQQQIHELENKSQFPILNVKNLNGLEKKNIEPNNNAASQVPTVPDSSNQSKINNKELQALSENENKPKYEMTSINDFINSLPEKKLPEEEKNSNYQDYIETLFTQDDAKKMLKNIIGKHKVLKENDGTQIIFN